MNNNENGFFFGNTKIDWIEFTTFGSLLGLSAFIGIYFGWFKGNQNTVVEYMLGGKSMNVFPIALSLIASQISGITLLGIPAEVYEYGTQFLATIFSLIFVVFITNIFYLPVFFDLQMYSIYEYLEMRFSKVVRLLASFIFALSLVLNLPIVIYIPALAFNQVTGTSVHWITSIICSICIFYTAIGGLKAVVWTDTVQSFFTLGSVVVVMILGVINVGGLEEVFALNEYGQRFELFNFNFNPFSRTTFWSIVIGNATMWIVVLTIHPGSIQRFVALPSEKAAKKSVFLFGVGATVIVILCAFLGMIMYAKYWRCDPLRALNMSNSGKLLPYFVQDVATSFPGLTGFFVSGLISAALSNMSAGLNTVAGTFYKDFVTLCLPKKVSDAAASFVLKIIVVLFGCICVALVYIVEKLGPIVQISYSLSGAPNGAIFSAFALGIFFPWVNWIGATVGMMSSIILISWMAIGAQLAILNNSLVYVGKPMDVSSCFHNVSMVEYIHPALDSRYEEVGQGVYADKDLFFMYKIAFMFYTPIGALVGIIVGLIVSLITGGNDLKKLNPRLITPPIRGFLLSSRKPRKVQVGDAIIDSFRS